MLFCQLNRHVSKNDRILCSIIQFRLKAVILPILWQVFVLRYLLFTIHADLSEMHNEQIQDL